jgi:uncharacterized membrane protein YedE/YeeE
VGALLLSLTAALFLVGLCWSCTRGWAALLLVALSLLGNALLFGGAVGLVVYLVVLVVVSCAYFSWAPNYYKERSQEKPFWLQVSGVLMVNVFRRSRRLSLS